MNNRGIEKKDDILTSYMNKDKVEKPQFFDVDSIVEINVGKPRAKSASSKIRDEQNPVYDRKKGTKQGVGGKSAPTGKKKSASGKKPVTDTKKSQPAGKSQGQKKPTGGKNAAPKKDSSQRQTGEKSRKPKGRPVSETGYKNGQKTKQSAAKKAAANGNKRADKKTEADKSRKKKSDIKYQDKISKGHSPNEIINEEAKRKRKLQRIRTIIAVCSTLIIVILLIGGVLYKEGKPIVNINIEGESVYTAKQIKDASGILEGDNMFKIRGKDISDRVSKLLPYVESIKVKHQFPDTIVLSVNETKDRYLISSADKYICVDENGKILSNKRKKIKENQYKLKGFDLKEEYKEGEIYVPEGEDKKRFEKAKGLIKVLESKELYKANVLELENLNKIIVVYDSRINIYLGESNDEEDKLTSVANVIQKEFSETATGYIEARYENRVYFKEGSMIQ